MFTSLSCMYAMYGPGNSNDSTRIKCSKQSQNACIKDNNDTTKVLAKICQKYNTQPGLACALFMAVLGRLGAMCPPCPLHPTWQRNAAHVGVSRTTQPAR
jgi:hypothetical protein